MCDKCDVIDAEIQHMQRLKIIAMQIQDARTIKAAVDLLAEMEARKKQLHPTQE